MNDRTRLHLISTEAKNDFSKKFVFIITIYPKQVTKNYHARGLVVRQNIIKHWSSTEHMTPVWQ